jgi:hypothetical protein
VSGRILGSSPPYQQPVHLGPHTVANTEENVLATLCGEALRREREAEFQAYSTTPEPIRQRWALLRRRIEAALTDLPPGALDTMRQHPRRGPLSGREILIVVARHAAEHLGQAELTRDLMKAATGSVDDGTPEVSWYRNAIVERLLLEDNNDAGRLGSPIW